MPWTVEADHPDCTAGQWAVVAEDTGTVAGCHDSRESAVSQIAALEAQDVNAGVAVDTKTLHDVEIKDADEGTVEAVFATFNVIDSDGDVTVPEAFTDGQKVRISAFNHGSWSGALPVGKGHIKTTDDEAILEGRFFLDTQHGRDHFQVVKEMGDLQEWSYSLDGVVREPGEFDGEQVQFIKHVAPTEVSPVIKGAGVDTRTLAAKSKSMKFIDHVAAVKTEVADLIDRAEDIKSLREQDGKTISDDSLSELEGLLSETKRLEALLTVEPDDLHGEAAAEYAKFVQITQGV